MEKQSRKQYDVLIIPKVAAGKDFFSNLFLSIAVALVSSINILIDSFKLVEGRLAKNFWIFFINLDISETENVKKCK